VRRVRRQRIPGGVDLLFGIAVIRGDGEDAVGLEDCSLEPANATSSVSSAEIVAGQTPV